MWQTDMHATTCSPKAKPFRPPPQQRKLLEQEKAKFELQIAKEKEFAREMANRLEAVMVTIASKVHEADKLYGSVTVRDIIDALKKQDVEVEKRMVLLNEPIKTIGTFKVPIRVLPGHQAGDYRGNRSRGSVIQY